MSKMNRYTGTLLTCAVELVIGILLLTDPVGFTTGIIIVLGLALMAAGLVGVTMIVEAAADCAAFFLGRIGLDGIICYHDHILCVAVLCMESSFP